MPKESPAAVTAGRIVHFVRPDQNHSHVAALVTSVADPMGGRVNLTLFLDYAKFEAAYTVVYDPLKGVGTWHWPERIGENGEEA